MSTTLPTTIRYVFFVHPRDALTSSHRAQLQAMFDEDELPEFKVKRFLLKNGELRAKVLMVQMIQEKADELRQQFDSTRELNMNSYW
jgi:hypothetical protein